MRFESARDALKHAQTFHQQLSQFYKHLTSRVLDEKSKQLLEYIANQEHALAGLFKEYERETPIGVLDTWFQYANDAEILRLPVFAEMHTNINSEEILTLSCQLSNELVQLYKQVEEQVEEPQVQDIFANLADMQLQKQKRITINYERLMDI
uniref:hypothetical protein n=1 Tax=Ningiella ruwaisensis TaxID=2364274 RepID=UPI00109FCDE7|nr:hypothetical protein [Ningiella ruwaisensis]